MPRFGDREAGRPSRPSIEIARTAWWYAAVRAASGWTEVKLERYFDETGREAMGIRRGSRWNKYRFGRSSPKRKLLERVNERFPGTLNIYEHGVWRLAGSDEVSPLELRRLAQHLPQPLVELIVDRNAPEHSPFWLLPDFSHRVVIGAVASSQPSLNLYHLDAVSALLVLARDGLQRQQERQHYEAYVAMAHQACRFYREIKHPIVWRLEANLFNAWLATEYKTAEFRATLSALRRVSSGNPTPWEPSVGTEIGNFGTQSDPRAALQARKDSRGYWAACKLSEMKSLQLVPYRITLSERRANASARQRSRPS
jgi:hypothetical protein